VNSLRNDAARFGAPSYLSTSRLTDIKHVVILMQENRSFDHYFGTLPGVRGFSDPDAVTLGTGKSVFYQPDPQNPDGYTLPFHLDTSTTGRYAGGSFVTGGGARRRSHSLADMADEFADVRLLGPPVSDGEYIALGEREVVHLHEYTRIYAVPGLYEHVVQELLQCTSPQVVTAGFLRAVGHLGLEPGSMTVLDVGAGTGLVGELVRRGGAAQVVGVDSLAAARVASLRDRPGVYADYVVGDFSLGDSLREELRPYPLGGLVSAGAFGGTHAKPQALENALAVLPPGAPVAFTIDERWMDESDPDGFGAAVERLQADGRLTLMERTRFQHRVTTTGEPIFYQLVVGQTAEVDDASATRS
jgi:SAM-dependent methyltransferase